MSEEKKQRIDQSIASTAFDTLDVFISRKDKDARIWMDQLRIWVTLHPSFIQVRTLFQGWMDSIPRYVHNLPLWMYALQTENAEFYFFDLLRLADTFAETAQGTLSTKIVYKLVRGVVCGNNTTLGGRRIWTLFDTSVPKSRRSTCIELCRNEDEKEATVNCAKCNAAVNFYATSCDKCGTDFLFS